MAYWCSNLWSADSMASSLGRIACTVSMHTAELCQITASRHSQAKLLAKGRLQIFCYDDAGTRTRATWHMWEVTKL